MDIAMAANGYLARARRMFSEHKILSLFLAVVLIYGGYYAYGKFTHAGGETRYVLAAVEKGVLVSSVSGSGQVSASNEISLKTKASGDVVYVGVKTGDGVAAGTLIAKLDDADAQKAVRDARLNLENAQLSLQKLSSQDAATGVSSDESLKKAYDDAFSSVADTFSNLPQVMAGLNDILLSETLGGSAESQWNIDYYYGGSSKLSEPQIMEARNSLLEEYNTAKKMYDQNFSDYQSASRFSPSGDIEKLISETYQTVKTMADLVKNTANLVQSYQDSYKASNLKYNSLSDTHLANLKMYSSEVNASLASLLTNKNSIGGSKIDLRAAELLVEQKKNILADAQENLDNYYIRAPFAGVIGKLDIQNHDSLANGASVGTIVTHKKIADISLNEVDISQVKVGDQATLTFDAVSDLSLTGKVSEMDSVGTVTQGVVSYGVKIVFDNNDDRIKPGMSISAAIITGTKENTLLVPNSAVKSRGNSSYVEVFKFDPAGGSPPAAGVLSKIPPEERAVEIGGANDSLTEVTSGLSGGEFVVSRTISPNTAATTQPSSGFRLPGFGGGGNFRAGGTR